MQTEVHPERKHVNNSYNNQENGPTIQQYVDK